MLRLFLLALGFLLFGFDCYLMFVCVHFHFTAGAVVNVAAMLVLARANAYNARRL